MEKYFYGVDISKDTLQIATRDLDGKWKDQTIKNEIATIETWLSNINLTNTHLVYEYTGTYTHKLTYKRTKRLSK